MNIQAMMKQAQKLQKDMVSAKKDIESMEFTSKSSFVEITASGDKKIKSVKIDRESMDKEDIEMLEDMLLVSFNDIIKQIEKVTDEKMGKYTQGMPGLF